MRRWVLLLALLALPAAAQEVTGQHWSAVGPRTLPHGGNAVEATLGFPGVAATYLHGLVPRFNLGARVAFRYAMEGLPRELMPGVEAQVLLKYLLLDEGRLSLGLTFEPGVLSHAPYLLEPRTAFSFPLGLRLGIAASSAMNVAVLLSVPLWVQLGTFGGVNVPIVTGVGVEYFLTSQLAAVARLELGPTLRSYPRDRSRQSAEFSFELAAGVAWRL